MAKGLEKDEIQRFALIGARARLAELEEERATLLRVFPGLRRGRPPAAAASAADDGASDAPPRKRRKRRKMSPEARKRISDMMKKRWAERGKKR